MTVQVEAHKELDRPFGLLLSKKTHKSDNTYGVLILFLFPFVRCYAPPPHTHPSTQHQFVIVGATKGSQAYILLSNGNIRIFDVIEMVNDKSCHRLPPKEPQESFDIYLWNKRSVKMRLNRTISLPSVSTTLTYGRESCFHKSTCNFVFMGNEASNGVYTAELA